MTKTDLFVKMNSDFDQMVSAVVTNIQTKSQTDNMVFARANIHGDDLWNLYIETIDPQYNPIFRERRFFEGNYDKNFIRRMGNLVFIENGTKSTIWDVNLPDNNIFTPVFENLSYNVKASSLTSYFLEKEPIVGHKPNRDEQDPSIVWDHFYLEIPTNLYHQNRDYVLGSKNTDLSVLRRSLSEVNVEDINLVLDLISENAIYRGNEHKATLDLWKSLKAEYDVAEDKEVFLFEKVATMGHIHLRNTVIGTLINDLYDGVELDKAVHSFEAKVAPANYKRTSAVITAKQVEDARAKLAELGYLDAIYREFATEVPSEHVLFRTQTTPTLSVFDDLKEDAQKTVKDLSDKDIVDVTMAEFLEKLPELNKVELLPTIGLESHQMVMTKGKNEDNMFKWSNNYAWSYLNSDTADAIKARVKAAGGNVEGDVRVSLAWSNHDDLDLHCQTPKGHLYFGNRVSANGVLDVDMNVRSPYSDNPVENQVWSDISIMPDGLYDFYVDQYTKRNTNNIGFQLQIEILGNIITYECNEQSVRPAITLVKENGAVRILEVSSKLKMVSSTSVGANDKYIEVTHITKSPNFWTDSIGNEHIFFFTNDFTIDKPVRGFFNEYLDQNLNQHRKVFEIMGTKLRILDGQDDALRGYGFSTTLHETVILRVEDHNGRKQVINLHV